MTVSDTMNTVQEKDCKMMVVVVMNHYDLPLQQNTANATVATTTVGSRQTAR